MSEKMQLVKIKEFLFGDLNVRTAGTPEAPMFAAPDVCVVLELKNSRQAIDALDDDEKGKLNVHRQGETWFITESGLYHLIFKSRKAAAAKFRRWVTSVVLPAIREGGKYVVKAAGAAEAAEADEMTLPDWLLELKVNPVEFAWLADKLLDRARRASVQMGFKESTKRERDGLVRYPRSVLDYAVGMVNHEGSRPTNAAWLSYFPEGFVKGAMRRI